MRKRTLKFKIPANGHGKREKKAAVYSKVCQRKIKPRPFCRRRRNRRREQKRTDRDRVYITLLNPSVFSRNDASHTEPPVITSLCLRVCITRYINIYIYMRTGGRSTGEEATGFVIAKLSVDSYRSILYTW